MATYLKRASLARVHARPAPGFYPRPLRPEPPADQAASDQKPASGENSEQGEEKPAVIAQPPQTNGDITEGQKQQRRQPRRRRQRNSESSTSKVGGSLSEASLKIAAVAQTSRLFFAFQNDTEKSASDPGTPPQTSKPGDLNSTLKSPKTTSMPPQESKAPQVTPPG